MLTADQKRTPHRPWSAIGDDPEFAALHGHWTDYAAWEQWMGQQPERLPLPLRDDLDEAWGEMGGLARSALYIVMCGAVDAAGEGQAP